MASEGFADLISRKYRLSLAVITALVLGNPLLVQPFLIRLATDAPLINLAGRQRMLSQKLAKAALGIERDGAAAAGAYPREIIELLEVWTTSHERLSRDARSEQAPIRAALADLAPAYTAMRDAARRLTARRDADPVTGPVATILANEADYLLRMDRLVGLYEADARARIETFRRIGWVLAGLTVAGLAAVGGLVLRPATSRIRRQETELRRARDELETRVRERTAEIEAANERHRVLLEQFSHAGRISAVGAMASALAHELNQPLGAIANYADGCLRALESPDPPLAEVKEALGKLRTTTLRAGHVVAQIRRFVTRRGPTAGDGTFDANRVVADMLELLGARTRSVPTSLRTELASGLPLLRGDSIQIQQVLVNLVRNALDSLDQSQVPKPSILVWTARTSDGDVEFGVSDNGEGIPADRLLRVFDPYFSTRADGMGMGLAICRTIVEAHQGRLGVESEPGVRTTFRFQLPAAPSDHERADGSHR